MPLLSFRICHEIDFEQRPPIINVSDTHWAKTWLLHPDAPKANKPEAICDLHEKILQNYLNQLGFLS